MTTETRRISLQQLDALFGALSAAQTLYLPVDGRAGARYERWEPGKTLSTALNTVRSPKDFFFPQTENLMDFHMEGKSIEIVDTRRECEDFILFGVRACDARSLSVLDKVFLAEPADSYYKSRREHGTLISLACDRPAETCFCATFGIDAAAPDGDVVCHRYDGYLYLTPATERGAALMATLADVTEATDAAPVEQAKQQTRERLARLPLAGLSADAFGAGKTEQFFSSPLWDSLSESCLGCGTCTFVCPTCQCYDIKDFNTGHGVKRFRCWDSCMYSDFTKMSAGQPRLTQKERFRQRFMHKLVYFPTNNDGMFSCVGCGRCVAKCPIQMNIVKVMKALGGETHDEQ